MFKANRPLHREVDYSAVLPDSVGWDFECKQRIISVMNVFKILFDHYLNEKFTEKFDYFSPQKGYKQIEVPTLINYFNIFNQYFDEIKKEVEKGSIDSVLPKTSYSVKPKNGADFWTADNVLIENFIGYSYVNEYQVINDLGIVDLNLRDIQENEESNVEIVAFIWTNYTKAMLKFFESLLKTKAFLEGLNGFSSETLSGIFSESVELYDFLNKETNNYEKSKLDN